MFGRLRGWVSTPSAVCGTDGNTNHVADVSSKMDRQLADVEKELDAKLANFGWNNSVAPNKSIQELLLRQGARTAGTPMMEVRDDIKDAKNVDLFRDVK